MLGFMFSASQMLSHLEKILYSSLHYKALFTGFGCTISYALRILFVLRVIVTILPKFKCPKGFFSCDDKQTNSCDRWEYVDGGSYDS